MSMESIPQILGLSGCEEGFASRQGKGCPERKVRKFYGFHTYIKIHQNTVSLQSLNRFLDDSTFQSIPKHASVPNAQGSLCTLSPHLVDPASMERPQTLSRPVQSADFHVFPLFCSFCFFSQRTKNKYGKNANVGKVQPMPGRPLRHFLAGMFPAVPSRKEATLHRADIETKSYTFSL